MESLHPLNLDFREHLFRRYAQDGRKQRFPGETREEFEAWQVDARGVLEETLRMPEVSGDLELEREPVDSSMLSWEGGRYEGFTLERIRYQSMHGVRVPAFLLIPDKLDHQAPAILCPPGHGRGMNQVLFEKGIYKQYPMELARRGFVTLVPEHVGFGERNPGHLGEHAYYTGVSQLLGYTEYGVYIRELMQAIDVLSSIDEVDADRIGCYGLSLGGVTTLLISALDLRIKAAGISGFFTSFRSTFLDMAHCVCGNVQDLALQFEHVDIAALIAPRPIVLENGRADPQFPSDQSIESAAELRRYFALYGEEERLLHDVFDGAHEISGSQAYDAFERWL